MAEHIAVPSMRRTRLALLWMNLTAEPLVALYTLIPFLLRKELGTSVFQISLFMMLRPVLSLFSFYWSAYLKEGGNRLVFNCVSASALAYLPFLFFPWVGEFWFLLVASALYQLFSKAALPSLIEILKRNLPARPREQTFSLFFVLSFVESGLLGMVFGRVLDAQWMPWPMLFSFAALFGLSSLLFFALLKVPALEQRQPIQGATWQRPWQESLQLLKTRADFRSFQGIFMVGGSALMLMLPAISSFYVDTLQLSYANITTARFVFMAVGVGASSWLWARGLKAVPLLKLTVWVLCGFGLFPLVLLFAQKDLWFLYLAFVIYGIAQAGSHLIWNLSGTFFAQEEDSSPYTRVSLLMHALRGAVMPLIGGLLCDWLGAAPVLVMGAALCFYGVYRFAGRMADPILSSEA